MARAERIADLERELVAAEDALVDARAAVAGIKAQLAVLHDSVQDRGDLSGLQRTEAILEVLRRARTTLSVDEIMSGLAAGGRSNEDRRAVRATLAYLVKSERISRVGRDNYTAGA
jgi:hypothetical protein